MEYAGDKPNFCQKCGCALNSTKTIAPPKEEVNVEEEVIEPIAQESVSLTASKLDFEIEKPPTKKLTVGELGMQTPNQSPAPKQPKSKKISKKKFLEEWKKEAGTSRSG
tara:strand:- start:2884 stop:3210 length:327 start_codon:yes stop_codon:yes gene_type:complete